jgi:hypothetical protein
MAQQPRRTGDDDWMHRLLKQELAFLRMVAAELQRVANEAPEIADRVRQIANKVTADAADLERKLG